MKAKYQFILLSLATLNLLASCGSNATSSSSNGATSSTSQIENVTSIITIRAYPIALNKNQVESYNFMKGVKATDSVEGDITSSVTYKIYNFYTNNEVREDSINFGEDGKFNVTYTARNSKGQTKDSTVIMEIGSPDQVYDEYGNKKICWGTGYDYDYTEIQSDYKLVYEETFDDIDTLNLNEWRYETGNGNYGWGNGESQYYTKDAKNCFINKDGKLVIRALKEEIQGFHYTSARIRTYGETSWKYGRFDIRAKLPMGGGSWPAIWMMPLDSHYGGWPKSGEIDIMETAWNYYRGRILGTTHTENGSGGSSVGGSTYIGDSIYDEYKTYSIEWLPDKIIWYVDGVSYYTYDPTRFSVCPSYVQWPYDQKFFLILNVAIGGGMGGNIADDLFDLYDVSMYVDYIRVYQSDIIANLKPTLG